MEAGHYRRGAGGISRGGEILHVAPPAERIPYLLEELILFLHDLDLSPLMKSCIFHYEFEFIHPYSDGNGRLGRLWQTLILSRWMPLFRDLALEALVRDHIAEYYDALNSANRDIHSGVFMEFMLKLIVLSLREAESHQAQVV
jgi:Fic family protein